MTQVTCVALDTPEAARSRIQDILDRFQSGKVKYKTPAGRDLILELRRIGRRFPAILIEDTHGDLFRVVPLSRIISAFGDTSPGMIEGISFKLQTMREELAGVDPPAVIRMAVEVAVACWLEFFMIEIEVPTRVKSGDTTVSWRTFEVRRTEAHKRFMRSLVTLERVRSGVNPRTCAKTIDVAIVEAG